MTRTTEVRAALDGDVAAICDICTRGYRATYPGLVADDFIERMLTEHYTAGPVGRRIAAAPPGWLGFQVAEEHGRVVGVAAGGLLGPGVGELFVLYADPDERGRGIGTVLLDRVTGQLREHGVTEMWVAVLAGNEQALRFYEARGFRTVERRRTTGSAEADNAFSWRLARTV